MKSPEEKEMEKQQDYEMGEFINKRPSHNYFEKQSFDEGFPSFDNLNKGFDTDEQVKKTNFLTGTNNKNNNNYSKFLGNNKKVKTKNFNNYFNTNNKSFVSANTFFKDMNGKNKNSLKNNPAKKASAFLGNNSDLFSSKKVFNPFTNNKGSGHEKINKMLGVQSVAVDKFSKNMTAEQDVQTTMNSFTMKDFIENTNSNNNSGLNDNQRRIQDIENQIAQLQSVIDTPLSGDENQRALQKREKSMARSKIVSLRQLQRQFQEQSFREQKFEVERQDSLRKEQEKKEERTMAQMQQNDARIQELELKRALGELSFQERKEIERLKQRAQNRRSRDDKEVALARLEREDMRADRQEQLELAKLQSQETRADRDREVELARIRAQARANENVFLENKLSQGQGLIGGLLSTGRGDGVNVALSSSPNDALRTQQGLERANFLAGAAPNQMGISSNVSSQLASNNASQRSFSDTVFDVLGATTPEREAQALQRQQEQEQMRMQQELQAQERFRMQNQEREQQQQQPMPMQTQTVQRAAPQSEPSRTNQSRRTVQTSQGVVEIDEDYAEYLKNSTATYRRGPYKKD